MFPLRTILDQLSDGVPIGECMKATSMSAVSHHRVQNIVTRVSIIFCVIHIAMTCIGSFHYHNFGMLAIYVCIHLIHAIIHSTMMTLTAIDATYAPQLVLICGYTIGVLSSFTNECTEPRRYVHHASSLTTC